MKMANTGLDTMKRVSGAEQLFHIIQCNGATHQRAIKQKQDVESGKVRCECENIGMHHVERDELGNSPTEQMFRVITPFRVRDL